MAKDFENIYRFEITTGLRPLVASGGDPRAAGAVPGGRRFYLSYVDGKVTSPRLDEAAVGRAVQGVLERAFGKELPALGEADARGLAGCLDPALREAIQKEIQERRLGELCASAPGLQQFLGRFATAAELRAARGPLARRLMEEAGMDVGLEGAIVTSGDWAFLRDDGVFCLDGRFTIQALDGTLISADLQARADVGRGLGGPADLQSYRGWQERQLGPDRLALPLSGLLRFEVSGDPGDKAEFAAPRWLRASGCSWKYRHLGRHLFLGAGTLELDRRQGSPLAGHACRMQLSVHEVHGRVLSRPEASQHPDGVTPAVAA
jgi:hypothetical protein